MASVGAEDSISAGEVMDGAQIAIKPTEGDGKVQIATLARFDA